MKKRNGLREDFQENGLHAPHAGRLIPRPASHPIQPPESQQEKGWVGKGQKQATNY